MSAHLYELVMNVRLCVLRILSSDTMNNAIGTAHEHNVILISI